MSAAASVYALVLKVLCSQRLLLALDSKTHIWTETDERESGQLKDPSSKICLFVFSQEAIGAVSICRNFIGPSWVLVAVEYLSYLSMTWNISGDGRWCDHRR